MDFIGLQRSDGLFGSLIIKQAPKNNKLHGLYDFDNITIAMCDWTHKTANAKFLGHYHGSGDNKPPNLLINGLGRYSNNQTRKLNNMPVATFVVKKVFNF